MQIPMKIIGGLWDGIVSDKLDSGMSGVGLDSTVVMFSGLDSGCILKLGSGNEL